MSTNETKGGGWEELFSDSRIRVHDKKLNREPECGERKQGFSLLSLYCWA